MTDKKMIAVFHYDNGRCGSEPYRYEELRRGEWIEINIKDYKAKCSHCGMWSPIMGNFCPNCGADMRKESE